MKALLSKVTGGPETLLLEDVPTPQVGANDVLIDVRSVGVNYPDALVIQDKYQVKPPRPFSPGAEVAGVVKQVGKDVTDFAVGDRVLAVPGIGGMAEQVSVASSMCAPIPASMDFEEAACLVATYGTSHYALHDRGQVKARETVLILGAAGGVGIAAIELAKAAGARVIAAVSSDAKLKFAMSAGADGGVVYPTGALDKAQQKTLADSLKEACAGGADIVYDAVGGDYAEPALRTLKWQGRYLVVGFAAGIPKVPLNLVLLKTSQIVGVLWGAYMARDASAYRRQVDALVRLHAEGKIKPRISSRYSLAEGAQAIREIGERRALGKVVVNL